MSDKYRVMPGSASLASKVSFTWKSRTLQALTLPWKVSCWSCCSLVVVVVWLLWCGVVVVVWLLWLLWCGVVVVVWLLWCGCCGVVVVVRL